MQSQSENCFKKDNLVLYKNRPARVISVEEKIRIELPDKKSLLVRPKDLVLLHPGPLADLGQLTPLTGDAGEVREVLEGETTTLVELAELLYGSFTPAAAWSAYGLLQEGLHFYGTPELVYVRSRDALEQEMAAIEARAAEKSAWQEFIGRLREGKIADEDNKRLLDLQNFALGRSQASRILKELNMPGTPENAHKLLLRLKVWDEFVNPYIQRLGFSTEVTYPPLGKLPAVERLDLTHLAAYAIDDPGNQDPDDALSFAEGRLWVHIADVAALVPPGSAADLQARAAALNLYLPEQTVHMLPPEATAQLGLGLQEVSPALSFCLTVTDEGAVDGLSIHPSLVRVTRLSYAGAEERLQESPFREIRGVTDKFCSYRRANNAVFIRFPEVKIRMQEGVVTIDELPPLASQEMVTEAMLMTGAAVADWAATHNIPMPYTTQPPPENFKPPESLAAMFACRRLLSPSQLKTGRQVHGGLGLPGYCRATSPLRRYLDLVVHQQLRAFLQGQPVLDEQAVLVRIGASEAISGTMQRLERLSNLHWTLVYLKQHPGWEGDAIVVERRGSNYTVLIPKLALEAGITSSQELALNASLRVKVTGIDLPGLAGHFKVCK